MAIPVPTVDDFTESTVMQECRAIVDYIINTIVPAINEGGGGGSSYVLPPATTSTLGGIIVGNNLTVDGSGKVNAPAPYKLPIGGTNIGGVKNGGNVTINSDGTMDAEGGSSNWEELDLNNLPTDFVDGDYLIVTCEPSVSCIVSSWTDSLNAYGIVIRNRDSITFITRVGIETSQQIISIDNVNDNAIALFYLNYVGTASEWNTGSGDLFRFKFIAFNGASASSDSDSASSVTRTNVSTHINKIIRMRI